MYKPQEIGPHGFLPGAVGVLADGDLAFLSAPGPVFSDGSNGFAIWNPTTNTLQTHLRVGELDGPVNVGPFAVSGDRAKLIVASADSDGTVYVYDSSTQAISPVNGGSEYIRSIIASPDGTEMYVVGNLGVITAFNLKTLQSTGQVSIPAGGYGGPGSVSADGKTLYVGESSGGVINAFDSSSLTWKGIVPGFNVADI